jgi:hypothetical protein
MKESKSFSLEFGPTIESEKGKYYGILFQQPWKEHKDTSVEIKGAESLGELFDKALKVADKLIKKEAD